MFLSDVAPGMRFVVTRVRVAGEIGRRLADMGFTEGSRGEMIRGALMRGPMQVRLNDYDLLIRRMEAASIEVLPDEGETPPQPAAEKPVRRTQGRGPHGRGLGRGILWRRGLGNPENEGAVR